MHFQKLCQNTKFLFSLPLVSFAQLVPSIHTLSMTSSHPGQRGAVMGPAPSVTVFVPLSSPLPQPHSDETVGSPALEIHQLFHNLLICSNNSWTRSFCSKYQRCSKCNIIYSQTFFRRCVVFPVKITQMLYSGK